MVEVNSGGTVFQIDGWMDLSFFFFSSSSVYSIWPRHKTNKKKILPPQFGTRV